MKKKKAPTEIRVTAIIVFIIAITVGGLILSFVTGVFDDKFNPEEDVCLKINEKNLIDCPVNQFGEYYPPCLEKNDECKDWRPKTKCELDPTNSECICDEGRISNACVSLSIAIKDFCFNKDSDKCKKLKDSFITCVYETEVCIKAHEPKTKCEIDPNAEGCICDDLINMSEYYDIKEGEEIQVKWGDCVKDGFCKLDEQGLGVGDELLIIYGYKCIKAHEANECELNNPDYVLDNSTEWTSTYGCDCRNVSLFKKNNMIITLNLEFWDQPKNTTFIRNETQCDLCYNYEKICRRKTIYDFECEELKENILKNYDYCDYKNKFNDGHREMCWTGWLHLDEIYDIAIEKGCEL